MSARKTDEEKSREFVARFERRLETFDSDDPRNRPRAIAQADGKRFRRWIMAGAWEDVNGDTHLDMDWLLWALEIDATDENVEMVSRFAATLIREKAPGARVVIRN